MILVTGAAGFIGYHVCEAVLARGDEVVALDNLSDYYSVSLKEARLERLRSRRGFTFVKDDVSDRQAMEAVATAHPGITGIVHLAAQAGVRHSLLDPYTYVTTNVMGQVVMLEFARGLKKLRHFVYASSSSVYGGSTDLPFSTADRVDKPQSIYAVTKRADELIAYAYSHLYQIAATGLRFFTVYGPWGRPDMAAYLFASAILAGKPIKVFNAGNMWRNFTYIDDIVRGVVLALDRPPQGAPPPHVIYNLGNDRTERLTDFIAVLEEALQRRAEMCFEPIQPGDVPSTHADIEPARRELGFEPRTSIRAGIPKFVAWFRAYHNV